MTSSSGVGGAPVTGQEAETEYAVMCANGRTHHGTYKTAADAQREILQLEGHWICGPHRVGYRTVSLWGPVVSGAHRG